MNTETQEYPNTRGGGGEAPGVEALVIFRCGWCGWPCHEDGLCIEIDNDQAEEYLKKHEAAETKFVNGACCPNGSYDYS